MKVTMFVLFRYGFVLMRFLWYHESGAWHTQLGFEEVYISLRSSNKRVFEVFHFH